MGPRTDRRRTIGLVPGASGGPDDVRRMTVFVRGRVQGVGFRWWARARALELGLVGHARNTDDGRVEVVAEGDAADAPAPARPAGRAAVGHRRPGPGRVGVERPLCGAGPQVEAPAPPAARPPGPGCERLTCSLIELSSVLGAPDRTSPVPPASGGRCRKSAASGGSGRPLHGWRRASGFLRWAGERHRRRPRGPRAAAVEHRQHRRRAPAPARRAVQVHPGGR